MVMLHFGCCLLILCGGTEDLQSHFEKFGDINNAVVKRYSSTGYSRGFGFVTFADPAVCDKVLLDKHVINGRTVSSGRRVCRMLASIDQLRE